ncbi:rhodanese-like domain-containing protein [Arhodomonas sp. SL1]|uniref:rhodanese-like domain-containing protein n=1 Tax=Arhodomonas sp. SL1 TaxID=3425691 RepID=UPI003F884216
MVDTVEVDGGVLEQWGPEELHEAFRKGEAAIIDVRTPQEFAFEHIRGALLDPLASFEPSALPSQEGKRLVFHCGSGVRSRRVAEACLAAGFGRVAHLEGGFAAWKQAGLPYVAIDPASGGQRMVGGEA